MREILSPEKVDFIKRHRKLDPGCFVRQEWEKRRTYNNCFLVQKRDTSDALFFVITGVNERIYMQQWDMFIYTDGLDSIHMRSTLEADIYDYTWDMFGTISSDGTKNEEPTEIELRSHR